MSKGLVQRCLINIHGDENEYAAAEETNKESICYEKRCEKRCEKHYEKRYEKRYEKCYEKCKHVALKNENQYSGTVSAPAPASDVSNVRDVRVQEL